MTQYNTLNVKLSDSQLSPLLPGAKKKVAQCSAAGLFKYEWPFCYYQALKG